MENNALDSQGGNTGALPVGVAFVADRNNNNTGFAYSSPEVAGSIPISQVGGTLNLRRLTLAAWIRPSMLQIGPGASITKWSPGTTNYSLFLNDFNAPGIRFYMGDSNFGTHYDLPGTTTCAINTWGHIAGSYDGTFLKIYVNGVLSNTRTAPDAFVSTGQSPMLGARAFGDSGFVGSFDEVQIYDRALMDAEVTAV